MVDTIKIDEQQRSIWAQESTLQRLLSATSSNNDTLIEFMKSSTGATKEQLSALDKAKSINDKNAKGTIDAVRNIAPKLDMSLNDAFSDLKYQLKDSVRNIKAGLTEGDLSGLMKGLSTNAKISSNNLFKMSAELPGLSRGFALLGSGLLAYIGIATAAWGTMTQLNTEFGKLYETGINFTGGLQGMSRAAGEMGLSTGELASTFTQFGAAVTYLGVDRAAKLGKEFSKLNRETGTLGMTNQQAVEAMLEYSELMRSTGMLSKLSNDEIVKGSQEYFKELNQISSVTGKQRKEIEKSIQAQSKDMDYQLILRSLPKDTQLNLQKALTKVQALGPEGAKAAQDVMTSFLSGKGVAGLDAATRNALNASGLTDTFESMAEKAKKGMDISGDMTKVAEKLGDPKVFQNFTQLAKAPGAAGDMARKIVEMAQSTDNFRANEAKLDEQASKKFNRETQYAEWTRAREEAKEAQAKQAEATNARQLRAQENMKAATNTLHSLFQTLAIDVLEPLLPVINLVAAGLEGIAGLFKKFADGLSYLISYIPGFSIIRGKTEDDDKADKAAIAAGAKTSDIRTGDIQGGSAATAGNLLAAASTVAAPFLYKYLKKTLIGSGGGDTPASKGMLGSMFDKAKSVFGMGKPGGAATAGAAASPMGAAADTLGDTKKTLGSKMADLTASLKEMVNNLTGAVKDAMSNLSKGISDTLSNLSKGVGDVISNVSKGLGDALSNLSKGVSETLTNLSKGIGDSLTNLSKGLGEAIANIGKGLGSGVGALIEGVLRGLAGGLQAMANPAILIGAGILAGSIVLIGGAIAGATWMMGKALPTMAEGLKAFGDIDGSNLISVGGGMIAIGAGLAAMGAGEVVNALGGLASGLLNFFSGKEDPIDRLKRFGQLSDPLSIAGDALNKFSGAFKGAIDILNSSALSPDVLKTMDQIKSMLGADMSTWMSSSPKIIGQINDLSASIAKLSSSSASLNSGSAAGAGTGVAGGISVTDLSKKTVEHYDFVKNSHSSMIDLLTILADKMDRVEQATKSGSNDIAKAISKASPNLM